MNETMTLGEKLKAVRRASGLTQVEMAKKIGIGEKTLWNYENDKRLISFEHLSKIAEVLGVDVAEFQEKNNNLNVIFNESFKESIKEHVLAKFKPIKDIDNNYEPIKYDFKNNQDKALTVILEMLYHDRLNEALQYNIRDFKEDDIIEAAKYILKTVELVTTNLKCNAKK